MIEPITEHLFEPGILSLREVLRLLLLSGLFTAVCVLAFPRNAPTRRLLLIASVTVLIVLPWALASVDAVWYVAVETLPPITLEWSLPNVLIWVWLVVAALFLGQHFGDVRRELKHLATLPAIRDANIEREVGELAGALEIEVPQLRLGAGPCSTTLAGATLVLPHGWQDWDDVTLRGVLAHEMIHIKRRDDRWLLLTRLVVLAYWWMPWLIWLYRIYVRVMDESCDDQASELLGQKLAYVDALVDAAVDRSSYIAATNMYQHHLVGRVGRFASLRVVEVDMRGLYWCLTAVLASVVFFTSVQPFEELIVVDAVNRNGERVVRSASMTDVRTPHVHDRLAFAPNTPRSLWARLANPTYQPNVIYPGKALNEGLQGEVIVEFSVTRDGSVVGARVVASSSEGLFDDAALRAVKGTTYPSAFSVQRTALEDAVMRPQENPVRIRRHLQFRLVKQ